MGNKASIDANDDGSKNVFEEPPSAAAGEDASISHNWRVSRIARAERARLAEEVCAQLSDDSSSDSMEMLDWSEQDVERWFKLATAEIQQYRSVLLPASGASVAEWTKEYLMKDKGIPDRHASQLVFLRDKMLGWKKPLLVRRKAMDPQRSSPSSSEPSSSSSSQGGGGGGGGGGGRGDVPNSASAEAATPGGGHSRPKAAKDSKVASIAADAPTTTPREPEQPSSSAANSAGGGDAGAHDDRAAGGLQAHQERNNGGKTTSFGTIQQKLTEVLQEMRTDSVMKDMAKKGTRHLLYFAKTVESVAENIPPPGNSVVKGVSILLSVVNNANLSRDNLLDICKRSVAIASTLELRKDFLGKMKQDATYKQAIDAVREVLEKCCVYAKKYGQRSFVINMIAYGDDKYQYDKLVSDLRAANDHLMLALALDAKDKQQSIEAKVDDVRSLLKAEAVYQDPCKGAAEEVKRKGGIEKVVADDALLDQVLDKMDFGTQMTIKTVRLLLTSYIDKGPQRHIIQSDLRMLWRENYNYAADVPWSEFWRSFPEKLEAVEDDVRKELKKLTAKAAAKIAFQKAVEDSNGETVSVYELKKAFNDDDLLEQVKQMIRGGSAPDAEQQQLGMGAAAGGGALTGLGDGTGVAMTGRIQLSLLDPKYTGREQDAEKVVEWLSTHGSALLQAEGGMGKSSLAVDVGWRLVAAGKAAAGVRWIDLREAVTAADVEARFCAALGVKLVSAGSNTRNASSNATSFPLVEPAGEEGHAGRRRTRREKKDNDEAARQLVTAANAWIAAHYIPSAATDASGVDATSKGASVDEPCALLMIIDNAEDALEHKEAANTLRNLLTQLTGQAPGVRMLVTSRKPVWPEAAADGAQKVPMEVSAGTQQQAQQPQEEQKLLKTFPVEGINLKAAEELVKKVCEGLDEEDAKRLAKACGCVPLVLCLVAETLVSGRKNLEEILNFIAPRDGKGSKGTALAVELVISSLNFDHQNAVYQLAIFPSTFDFESAAAILDESLSEMQTRGLLETLCRQSVLQRIGTQKFLMHMLVREQVEDMAPRNKKRHAEGRFVAHMLQNLRDWTTLYESPTEWKLALAMIRDREPDVGKLLELLKTGHSSKITWDAFAAAGVMTQSLWELFEAASLTTDTSVLEEVCDKLLARLEKMGTVMSLLTEDDTDIIEGSPLPVTLPPGGTQQQTEARLQQQQYQLAVSHVLYMSTKVYDVPDDALLCLRIRCKYLGQTHPFTLQAFCNRAEEFTSHQTLLAGRLYRQALELVRQAPELEKDKLRNLTLTLMYKYACFLWKQKEQGSFNWDDPPFKWLRWNVGDKPKEDGRMEEAHQKLCKVLKRSSEERGDLHPFTITVRSSLATFLEEQGDVEGAAKEHEIALKASKTTLGGDHIDTFWSRLGLARCQARLGKYSGAVMLFVEALDKLDKVLQSDDKEQIRLQTEGNLADCLLGMGDLVKAELQYDKVFDMHDTMDPVMGPPLELKVNYARCLACQGKFTAAESEYREAFFKAYVGPQRHKEGEDPDGCRLQNDICMGLKDAIEKQSRIFDLEVEKKNAEERQRKEAEERQELGAGGAATAALTIPRNSGGALRRNGDSTGSGSGCSTTTTTSSSQPSIRNRQLQQSSINNGPPGRVPSARSQQ